MKGYCRRSVAMSVADEILGMLPCQMPELCALLADYFELRRENDELRRENDELRRENDELRRENDELRRENDELRRENDELRRENDELRREYCVESLPNEEWRDVEGYEGVYQVSNLGRVKNFSTSKVLKLIVHEKGRLYVKLCKKGAYKMMFVHVLVARAFIPNPECKPQVNHKNGIKTDNRVENLEWVTASENLLHAYEIGLKVSARRKLSVEDVLYIRENPDGLTRKQLAKMFGICVSTLDMVRSGRTYAKMK